MPGAQAVLVGLARQMYEDIRFITEQNPTQVVDDDTARMFNTLLAEAQQAFRSAPLVFSFNEMSPRTLKYKDALVVVGQLYRLLAMFAPPPAARPAAAPARQPSEALDPSLDEGEYDEQPPARALTPEEEAAQRQIEADRELYGDGPQPPKVNPDGTIPFSLMDEDHKSEF